MPSSGKKRGGLYIVSIGHDPGRGDEVRGWYESERMPDVLKCAGVTAVTTWETVERYVPAKQGGLMAVPGFPAYTAIYELTDVNAVRSEPFLDAVGRTFGDQPMPDGEAVGASTVMSVTCAEIMRAYNPGSESAPPARGMMVVSITPERDHEALLHEWYDTLHLPELLACPGFLGARRFKALEGIPNFFALYYLDEPGALKTEMFRRLSGRTFSELPPLTQRLGPHMMTNICDVYRAL